VKAANKKLLRAYGIMIGALTTTLQNLRVVKAYTAEAQEEARLDRIDRGMFRQQLRLAKLDAFVSPVMETVAVVAGSFVAVWLLSRVLNHQLSLSKFASLGAALSILFDPLRKLSDVWVRIQRAVAAGERIFQVIDMPGESEVASGTIELGSFKESVVYSDVTFTYPGATHPALNGVNLNIQKGETVAIVGPNGSGKTTLVSMLLRLFDPDRGEIRYDGIDLRQARLDSLRRQIGLVTQEAVVFAGTPAENIAYGMKSRKVEKSKSRNPALENGRVQDAAKMAFADEFIQRLPGGYGTLLGEQGTTLSGGQRQRLAIARAVHRDAPILIFDEATSQIDSESERKIQAALQAFSRGRTTLIVAHRLSTIQCADRIIVMDAGRIIDQGTHADLYIRCPLYRTLCDTQFVTAG
jgi:subfamily B ATP-binding cassette protein MsbA